MTGVSILPFGQLAFLPDIEVTVRPRADSHVLYKNEAVEDNS